MELTKHHKGKKGENQTIDDDRLLHAQERKENERSHDTSEEGSDGRKEEEFSEYDGLIIIFDKLRKKRYRLTREKYG